MPSLDIVSKINMHEVKNAVDQANREVAIRFDFKDSGANFELSDDKITLTTTSDFHLKQMKTILIEKLTGRKIDIRTLIYGEVLTNLKAARQEVTLKKGIEVEVAKQINKLIKESKLKVQSIIQGDQIRITGKKRDDLQTVISLLRKERQDLPLQFENFRD